MKIWKIIVLFSALSFFIAAAPVHGISYLLTEKLKKELLEELAENFVEELIGLDGAREYIDAMQSFATLPVSSNSPEEIQGFWVSGTNSDEEVLIAIGQKGIYLIEKSAYYTPSNCGTKESPLPCYASDRGNLYVTFNYKYIISLPYPKEAGGELSGTIMYSDFTFLKNIVWNKVSISKPEYISRGTNKTTIVFDADNMPFPAGVHYAMMCENYTPDNWSFMTLKPKKNEITYITPMGAKGCFMNFAWGDATIAQVPLPTTDAMEEASAEKVSHDRDKKSKAAAPQSDPCATQSLLPDYYDCPDSPSLAHTMDAIDVK